MMNQLGNKTKPNEGKTMLWAFTQNNAQELQKKLENIEEQEYDLYIKEKTGEGLTIILLGQDDKKVEIDTHTLEIISTDVSKEALDKFRPLVNLRLTKTNQMLNSIGR